MRKWAYARTDDTSDQRRENLAAFLFRYNWHRPRGGSYGRTPIGRPSVTEDNLLMLHI